MPQLGPAEVLVILVVALLVFGPKRLPEVGRQVGRGLRELRRLQETVGHELREVMDVDGMHEAVHGANRPGTPPSLPPRTDAAPDAPPPAAPAHAPSRFRAPGH
jgi:TatA/E family protein of Tat protein translocase